MRHQLRREVHAASIDFSIDMSRWNFELDGAALVPMRPNVHHLVLVEHFGDSEESLE